MNKMIEKIFKKAKAEGRAEDRAECIAEYQISTALNMIERGYQNNEISVVTGVPIKKMAEIRSGKTV